MIVIPAIDLRRGRVVRLTQGRPETEAVMAEDPVAVARRFADQGAEWLHVVDLDAALGTGDNRAAVASILRVAAMPVQVGGGLRTMADVEGVLGLGAERVVLGTEALTNNRFLRRAIDRFGERCVVSVDVDGEEVRVRGWTEGAGSLDRVVPGLEGSGVARLLATSIRRDGTLQGPDLELYERLASLTSLPVIASGGVRDVTDLIALADRGVESVVVGKALLTGRFSLAEARDALGAHR